MEAALLDGKWEGTIGRVRKNGERFRARVVITPRQDTRGKAIGYLLISKDITAEIRLTEELKATQFYAGSLIEASLDDADPEQMEQVMSNLVVNARQSMARRGTIHVRCEAADPDTQFSFGKLDQQQTFVQWSVTDEGSGIPADIVDHIFDPLFTTKRTGTGLGLSVAAQVIEKHGGKIGLETRLGQGTTFHVLLPGVSRDALPGVAGRWPQLPVVMSSGHAPATQTPEKGPIFHLQKPYVYDDLLEVLSKALEGGRGV